MDVNSLHSMDAEERDAMLDKLEQQEVSRLEHALKKFTGDDRAAEQILASLTAIVYRRVSKSLRPVVEDLGETIAGKIIQFVHGSTEGFYVEEARYGDWIRNHSGTVWLHPDLPYTLRFAARSQLQFVFTIEGPKNGAEFKPLDGGVGQIRIGLQTTPKLIPINLIPEDETGNRTMEFLIQMYVTPTPYGEHDLLQMDYSTFWKSIGRRSSD